MYPLHLADAAEADHLLPGSGEWSENLGPEVASCLAKAYGRQPKVEEVAWYVFGVLSAPSYRQSFAAALAIDHPRVPFSSAIGPFERMAELGRRLGAAHLFEAPILPDIRFVGEGSGVVERIRTTLTTDP
ncbi:MAG TPA: type ISP restriction/modification enzyme [Terriglobales bacterium]|nr:type ISP restriction/modification enzyme [Terriglobales bacterium]